MSSMFFQQHFSKWIKILFVNKNICEIWIQVYEISQNKKSFLGLKINFRLKLLIHHAVN